MKTNHPSIKKLLEKYREIVILNQINSTLGYDLNVFMPEGGTAPRASQIEYITALLSDKWQDSEFKSLIQDIDESKLSDNERAVIRNLRHLGKVYFRVPKKLLVELSGVTSKAYPVWHSAKVENDYKSFLPYLEKILDLNREIAEKLGYSKNPYDALLDQYEPGLTAEACEKLFQGLVNPLSDLLKKVQKSKAFKVENEIVNGDVSYPLELQKALSNYVARLLLYNFNNGRLDTSSHPFTDTLARTDVRITTRYQANDFRYSLTSTIHEVGHALYEQNVNPDYEYTPLDGGVSLGIHESQSRFWENQVGRSPEFLQFLLPTLKAFFPEQFETIDHSNLVMLLNEVKPSLIRTESDEVTYNLHIALRFEIENALINKKLEAKDAPEFWREKMKKYFGIIPETDREGVLQDVHWAHGSFGYFPTYSLGTLAAAQISEKLRQDIDLEECIKEGNMKPIFEWLRTNIHTHGSLYTPKELLKRVTGRDLSSDAFLSYIQKKYSKLYRLKV